MGYQQKQSKPQPPASQPSEIKTVLFMLVGTEHIIKLLKNVPTIFWIWLTHSCTLVLGIQPWFSLADPAPPHPKVKFWTRHWFYFNELTLAWKAHDGYECSGFLGQEAYHILPFTDMNREKHRWNYPLNPGIWIRFAF